MLILVVFLIQALTIFSKAIKNISSNPQLAPTLYMENIFTTSQIPPTARIILINLNLQEYRVSKSSNKPILITQISPLWHSTSLWTHHWCTNLRRKVGSSNRAAKVPKSNLLQKKEWNLLKHQLKQRSKPCSQFIRRMWITLNRQVWIKEGHRSQAVTIRAWTQTS